MEGYLLHPGHQVETAANLCARRTDEKAIEIGQHFSLEMTFIIQEKEFIIIAKTFQISQPSMFLSVKTEGLRDAKLAVSFGVSHYMHMLNVFLDNQTNLYSIVPLITTCSSFQLLQEM